MKKLSDILNKRYTKGSLAWQVQASLVVEEAKKAIEQVLGSDLACEVKVLYYKDKKIFLATPSPDLATQVKMQKHQLIKKLKKVVEVEINDLVIWVR